jgi:hypothetical protein
LLPAGPPHRHQDRLGSRPCPGLAATVWTGTDSTSGAGPRDLIVNFSATSYLTQRIVIYVDTDHAEDVWEEIDAVQLRGSP